MKDPDWVEDEVVLAIHEQQLAEHGGIQGIRDLGLLSSALSRPKHLHHYSDEPPDLAALAAAYAFGIVRNHPFFDGNKRTGYVVCRTFLKLNGADFDAPQKEKYEAFLRLAEGSVSEAELAAWIRVRLGNV